MRYLAKTGIPVALLLLSLGACKGRTTDNMVPTGDTVEVVIAQPVQAPDSVEMAEPALPDSIAPAPDARNL